jgi:serine/threonine protein kinase
MTDDPSLGAPPLDEPSLDDPAVEDLVSQVVDEFMERRAHGERPAVEEYAARHPAIANLLRQILPALDVVRFATPEAEAVAPLTGCLGDYCILREVGRGSMGVVYEAEQVSLQRRVALKVLPFAAALDGQRLQRFKTEALAAAHLHHQNIVPVYAVGCERGVHYYAMQFIEGQTLAAVIESEAGPAGKPEPRAVDTAAALAPSTQRSARGASSSKPFFREVARLGVQAAEALAHAHQAGILHRDIKPANLMLDAHGNLWVTDFGLAHVQGDGRLTITGDLVGTLRYMSPEQALGRSAVDQRTDVYSLGATLYELLARQPAFRGSDRGELLQQIASEEPRPLRAANRDIPVELETIVHKALAKEPEGRYATAQALADDLRRYLDDKPIHARPPTLHEKARKWLRRHRPVVLSVVVAAVVLLLSGFIGLAVYNRQLSQERDEKNAALAAAQAQRRLAEANLHRALDAIERMLEQVNDKELAGVPGMEKVRLKISEDALDLCRQLQDAGHHDPAARHCTARAYYLAGTLKFAQKQAAAGEEAVRQARRLYQELAEEFPDSAAYRDGWAQASLTLGHHCSRAGHSPEADAFLREAVRLWQDLVRGHPPAGEAPEKLVGALRDLAYFYWTVDRHPEAEARYQEALKLLPLALGGGSERGRALHIQLVNSFGVFQRTTGRWLQAEESFTRALDLLEKYRATGGVEDARAHGHLGIVLWQLGRDAEAEPHLYQALELREKFRSKELSPDWDESTLTRRWLALWLAWVGRADEAERAFQEVLRVQEEMEARHWGGTRSSLAVSRRLLANLYRDTDRTTEAEPLYRQALRFQEDDAVAHPNDADRQLSLAVALEEFGRLLFARGERAEAHGLFQKAEQALGQAARLSPNRHVVHYRRARLRADCPDVRLRDADRAVADAETAVALAPEAAACWNVKGMAGYRAGRFQAAVKALEQAMALRSGGNSYDWFFLAMAYARLGEEAQARAWYDRAVAWMDRRQPQSVELLRYRAEASQLLDRP